jgi:hypothetical protein
MQLVIYRICESTVTHFCCLHVIFCRLSLLCSVLHSFCCQWHRRLCKSPCTVTNASDCVTGEEYISSRKWCFCCSANCCGASLTNLRTYLITQYIVAFAVVRADAFRCESHPGSHAYRKSRVWHSMFCAYLHMFFFCNGNEMILIFSIASEDGCIARLCQSFVREVRDFFRFRLYG